ncbi:GNAT family N-acetyltransferase [Candidatus Leptofilum sp.]|uniref:GNAT family N-acetyltransferase n=1 Tax=Candidatus Leptofilum sp. TaxID=3241576 RepID=UPI003B5BBEC2
MNREEIMALYDVEERENSEHPSYLREVADGVVRSISKNPSRLSFIIYSQLTTETADAAIQAQLDYFQASGGYGFEWKTYAHDTPADLPQRLLAHGLEADEEEALLVMDLHNCPAIFLQPVTADVRRATTRAQFEQIAQLQTAVWGGDYGWLVTQLEDDVAQQPDYWSIYIAYVNSEPACAAWVSFPQGSQFAGLWGGSTLKKYRKMGLYTAVVAIRAQEALQRGYRFLMVDASDMSRPILEKRGFQFLTHTTPYTWKNPNFKEK